MYTKQIAHQKSQFNQEVRNFFTSQDFLEVETPIMVKIPGMEPHLTPFETTLDIAHHPPQKLYLNTSPELQMKKLLAAGFGNIFNITKVFRNGEIGGPLHNPEFTMLEWYRENADYFDMMEDCENLIKHLAQNLSGTITIPTPPWPRISTNELFIKFCDIDLLENQSFTKLQATAAEKNFDTNGCQDWDDIFFKIFLNHIEPKLPKSPLFIYDYPSTQAALAKKSAQNPFFAERFELYIDGIELANAFSELIDAQEQRQRLIEEQKLRKKLHKTIFDIDGEFLAALESISQPCAGIALGMDRLFMVLMNLKSVKDTLWQALQI